MEEMAQREEAQRAVSGVASLTNIRPRLQPKRQTKSSDVLRLKRRTAF